MEKEQKERTLIHDEQQQAEWEKWKEICEKEGHTWRFIPLSDSAVCTRCGDSN